MKKLKFNADYAKLSEGWQGTEAVLIEASFLPKGWIKGCPEFVEYDTRFRGEEGNYALPDDDLIMLVFLHKKSQTVFTTLRRYTMEKFKYYEGAVYETFELVYSGEANVKV